MSLLPELEILCGSADGGQFDLVRRHLTGAIPARKQQRGIWVAQRSVRANGEATVTKERCSTTWRTGWTCQASIGCVKLGWPLPLHQGGRRQMDGSSGGVNTRMLEGGSHGWSTRTSVGYELL